MIAGLLLGQTLLLNGQGFGFLPLDSVPPGFAIAPMGGARVEVAWIDAGPSGSSVMIEEYQDGLEPDSQGREIYSSTRKFSALKLEMNADDHRFLSVTERVGYNYLTRLLRYDPEYRELGQALWGAKSPYSPPGRMLGPDDRLFVSSCKDSASGRFVDGSTLKADVPLTVQTSGASGLDTLVEDDGSVTALYQFSWLRMKHFGPDRRLKTSMLLDRPPYAFFTRSGMTALAMNESRTTLVAWEWHQHTVIEDELKRFPSIPAFRAIKPDGTMTDTIRLQPASSYSDRYDRPAVGIRPDGSGAVAWTVRTGVASTVWLQRLDANQGAYEAPRLVDARPAFYSDQPTIKSDAEGNLFLAWRCTAIEGDGGQIGILELSQLDEAPSPPRVTCVAESVRIDWVNRPASRNSLWHSSDLNPDHAQQIHRDEGLAGPCHHEHTSTSSSGFYWLRSE